MNANTTRIDIILVVQTINQYNYCLYWKKNFLKEVTKRRQVWTHHKKSKHKPLIHRLTQIKWISFCFTAVADPAPHAPVSILGKSKKEDLIDFFFFWVSYRSLEYAAVLTPVPESKRFYLQALSSNRKSLSEKVEASLPWTSVITMTVWTQFYTWQWFVLLMPKIKVMILDVTLLH